VLEYPPVDRELYRTVIEVESRAGQEDLGRLRGLYDRALSDLRCGPLCDGTTRPSLPLRVQFFG
jgi:hypothetical protein